LFENILLTSQVEHAKSAIALQEVRFTASPTFDNDGKMILPPGDFALSPGKFFGESSPTIEAAWVDLTGGTVQ